MVNMFCIGAIMNKEEYLDQTLGTLQYHIGLIMDDYWFDNGGYLLTDTSGKPKFKKRKKKQIKKDIDIIRKRLRGLQLFFNKTR